jgi:hypothetical protein
MALASVRAAQDDSLSAKKDCDSESADAARRVLLCDPLGGALAP